MSGKSKAYDGSRASKDMFKLVGVERLKIDSQIMQELEEEYAKIIPTPSEMKAFGDAFRIRRAIKALETVMLKRNLELNVKLEELV